MTFDERLQAALGSAYRLERELGGGGMSRVFVATESALGRQVVIKVLPPELAAGLSVDRFRREIQLAASLQHPHIVPLLAAGPAGDMLYYTMPLIEGESLRTRIARGGELPVGETVRILRDVVDALACAHERGIVHRDIKPDNVLISRHHGLVADFGVAKALSEATGESSVTSTGIALGTPAYMSPEQATADPHVDHRADIYAVGALAYEMLTGRPPFSGNSAQAVLAAQVTQIPDPVTRHRSSIPPALSALVMRCLEKRPADRFQSADELLHLLENMATPSAGTVPTEAKPAVSSPPRSTHQRYGAAYLVLGAIIVLGLAWSFARYSGSNEPSGTTAKTIVVLPFENLGRSEDEYFADGVTEEITNRLTGLSGLRVISRNSAKGYKGTRKPLKQVGQEVGATFALTGTVRWERSGAAASHVRVSPELVRLDDGTGVWAHGYNAVVSDIFGIQSEIAEQVAGALDVALAAPVRQALATRPTRDPQAYDFYLRGKQYFERGFASPELHFAESLYRKALDIDPKFALAWAALARTHDILYWFYFDRTQERLAQEKEAAEQAVKLDPRLPEAHVAMGFYHYHGKLDYAAALREFQAALQLRPGDAEAYGATALVERRQGRWQEAYRDMKRSVELDPRSYPKLIDFSDLTAQLRRLDESEQYLIRAKTLTPSDPSSYGGLSRVALARGDRLKAVEIARDGLKQLGPDLFVPAMYRTGNMSQLMLLVKDGYSAELHRPGLAAFGSDSFMYYIANADLYRAEGLSAASRAYSDSVQFLLQARLRADPQDGFFHGFLSWAYAFLGRKRDAIQEGTAAVKAVPLSRDAMDGQTMKWFLARTYAQVGEPDEAVSILRELLTLPTGLTLPGLRVDPVWDPLRGNPRFEALLAGK
jgi:serine/threonine protein kinase/tetratricopeptide (TPR) repeat protein